MLQDNRNAQDTWPPVPRCFPEGSISNNIRWLVFSDDLYNLVTRCKDASTQLPTFILIEQIVKVCLYNKKMIKQERWCDWNQSSFYNNGNTQKHM